MCKILSWKRKREKKWEFDVYGESSNCTMFFCSVVIIFCAANHMAQHQVTVLGYGGSCIASWPDFVCFARKKSTLQSRKWLGFCDRCEVDAHKTIPQARFSFRVPVSRELHSCLHSKDATSSVPIVISPHHCQSTYNYNVVYGARKTIRRPIVQWCKETAA